MGELLPIQTTVPSCYGCGQENSMGLKLRFSKEDDNTVSTELMPPQYWSGWHNIIHGGFLGLLLDETMAWAVWGLRASQSFVTREMTVRYKRPVNLGQKLSVIGRIVREEGAEIRTTGEVRDAAGKICTEAEAVIILLSADHRTKLTDDVSQSGG